MLLPPFEFHEPLSIEDALELKKKLGENARLLAGGTDLLVHLKKKLVTTDNLISLSRIKELSRITQEKNAIVIGACATMSQLSAAPIVQEKFKALKAGCDNLGSHLIRNRATIGGNACNASPAGDALCPLLVYDAVALVASSDKKREIPIADFFTGPGKSCLNPYEILLGFRLPIPGPNSDAHYIQLGKRKSSEINVVNVASLLGYDPDTGRVTTCRIALGSVAATPVRSPKAESSLLGQAPEEASFFASGEMARREDCRPIDDFRGTAGYRQAMVGVLTKRTLATAYDRARGAAL